MVFQYLDFSARFSYCVHKYVYLFAKFSMAKLFSRIEANAEKELEVSQLSLIKFSYNTVKYARIQVFSSMYFPV